MFFVARSRNFHRRAYLIFNFPAVVAHAFVFTSISRPGPEGFSLAASFPHLEKCVGTLYIDSKKGGAVRLREPGACLTVFAFCVGLSFMKISVSSHTLFAAVFVFVPCRCC